MACIIKKEIDHENLLYNLWDTLMSVCRANNNYCIEKFMRDGIYYHGPFDRNSINDHLKYFVQKYGLR